MITNATFTQIVADLTALTARKAATKAYGMWNPAFCAADGSAEAIEFFRVIRKELDWWEAQARRPERVPAPSPNSAVEQSASIAPDTTDEQKQAASAASEHN